MQYYFSIRIPLGDYSNQSPRGEAKEKAKEEAKEEAKEKAKEEGVRLRRGSGEEPQDVIAVVVSVTR